MKFIPIHIPGAGWWKTVLTGRRWSPDLKAMETVEVTGPPPRFADSNDENANNPPEGGQ